MVVTIRGIEVRGHEKCPKGSDVGKKILRSQRKGEEMRKTVLFFIIGGLSKASFSCPLILSFPQLGARILG